MKTPNIYIAIVVARAVEEQKMHQEFILFLASRRYVPLSIAASTTSKYKNNVIKSKRVLFFFSFFESFKPDFFFIMCIKNYWIEEKKNYS